MHQFALSEELDTCPGGRTAHSVQSCWPALTLFCCCSCSCCRTLTLWQQAAAGTTSPGSWLLSYINVTKYDSSSSQAGPTSLFSYDYPLAVGDCITLVELTVLYEMKRDVMAQARKNLTSSFTAAGPFVRCAACSRRG